MNVPKLRFKEFNDEWIEEKINELVELNPKNPSLPENFIYIDLESVSNGILLQEKIINKNEAPSRAQRQVKINDILYQTVRPYQKNNLFIDKLSNLPYIASTGYAILREKKIYPKFLFNKLHTDNFVNEVLDNCTGTSYPAINSNDLGNIKIYFPSNVKEQEKVGDFLSLLDKKIELQTKKIENLKLFKKGLIRSISNNIKASKKINDICIYENGTGYENYVNSDGNYKLISLNSLDIEGNLKSNCKKILIENPDTLLKGDIVMVLSDVGHGDFLGISALIPRNNEYVLNQRMGLLRIKDNSDPNYIVNIINANQKKFKVLGQGSSQLNLSKEDILNVEIPYPEKEMQTYYSRIFDNLSKLIYLNEEMILRLIELKKGLMQNMFV